MKKILFLCALVGGLTQAAEPAIKVEKISNHLHILYGGGGNVVLSTGNDGNYLTDAKYAKVSREVLDAVKSISPGELRYVINTHVHGDHTGGNVALKEAGADLIAQENVYNRLADKHGAGSAYLPELSYGHEMKLHFNNEHAHLVHYSHAHTDGDTVIFFEVANAVHLSDIYFNLGSLPFVDVDNGGSLDGVIAAVEDVLAQIRPSTKVIPGHGPLSDKAGLTAYLELLKKSRSLMRSAMKDGATLEQVLEARPLASLNLTYSNWLPEERVTRLFYRSLKARTE